MGKVLVGMDKAKRGYAHTLPNGIMCLLHLLEGTLPIFEDAQRLESALKMPRRAFDYICNLVKEESLENMNKYTFVDGRLLCLEDRVAVAVIVLNSGETPAAVGRSVGVSESTVSMVTERFVYAMDRPSWAGTTEMEKIKYKFDMIHGLPNCCGVVHAARIPFGSQNGDHEKKNEDLLIQVVVDSYMRFTYVHLGSPDNMESSISHDSQLFTNCENGTWLNGSKLNLSDGWQVGEYVIGDAGYPLLTWLLTPYRLENDLSGYQVEFNRRHSEAMAVVPRSALERLKDTWKFLRGGGWCVEYQNLLEHAIYACCKLHNIVIEMECKAGTTSNDAMYSRQELRRVADEDAAMARDILSQHLTSKQLESGGTLAIFEDAQRLESVMKMPRRTFDYVCSLLKESSLEIMNNYFFFDMRFFSLEERVAIALIMLTSGDPPATVGSFIGVNESTVSLVTKSFVYAMFERAKYHMRWPQSDEMEKVKSKFDKNHGLPNCCGVMYTTHIPSASRSWDYQDKYSFVLQGVVDSDMRFTSIWGGLKKSNWDDSRFFHTSVLFKNCEKGVWLNGSKLKVSSEKVGEYVIGDAGYPLLPWLLTPYELQNDLADIPSYQAEFNRRHSSGRNIALKAMARLEDTWKFLNGEWRPNEPLEMSRAISVCCRLHNIVIGMEEGAGMPSDQDVNYSDQARQLADEDAVRARDILSQYMTSRSFESRVEEVDQDVQQEAASSSSGDKEQQEAHMRTAEEEKPC